MPKARLLPPPFALLLAACAGSPAPPPVVEVAAAPVAAEPEVKEPAPPKAPPPPVEPAEEMHVARVPVSPDDPLHGVWTLADATRGLPATGALTASIETSLGTLECTLFEKQAPRNTANFVGLARGTRPWKTPSGRWKKIPAYDGTIFHRVIRGFMIQGGDPKRNGSGDAGYLVPDELWPGAHHDRAGLLCTANRGPNTNSMQFFITDDAAPHLDVGYTIFGECGPVDLVHQLAAVPTVGDRPAAPLEIVRVSVRRR